MPTHTQLHMDIYIYMVVSYSTITFLSLGSLKVNFLGSLFSLLVTLIF